MTGQENHELIRANQEIADLKQQRRHDFAEKVKTDGFYRELAAQYEVLRSKNQYLELEIEEIRSDGELHAACLHMPISISLGANVSELQRATERKNKFLSKVLTKVTASRNEMCEIFTKMNDMTRAAGLGHCDFSAVMGPAEGIEGKSTFTDIQAGKKRAMTEDWAKIGQNLREKLMAGDGELFTQCFENKLVADSAEIATQTDRKPATPREAKEKKRVVKKKMMAVKKFEEKNV